MKKLKCYVLIVSQTFPNHHRRAGDATYFRSRIVSGRKKSTIRANYNFWAKRIEEVQKGNAYISIRYWEGRPYNSKQIEIDRWTINNRPYLHFNRIQLYTYTENIIIQYYNHPDYHNMEYILSEQDIKELSKIEGFNNVRDFWSWFNGDLHYDYIMINSSNNIFPF